MHEALIGLKGIRCRADDILIAGMGETEVEAILDHNQNLCALMDRCHERGIKLNKQKQKLNRPSMVFCGHELTRLGVCRDQRKVEAIMNMPPPQTGRVYYTYWEWRHPVKFCPNFSSVFTAPIRTLLLKENEFCWREEVHGVAFNNLKALLINAPVLAYFDSSKPI